MRLSAAHRRRSLRARQNDDTEIGDVTKDRDVMPASVSENGAGSTTPHNLVAKQGAMI
jgi:hypothetical protein